MKREVSDHDVAQTLGNRHPKSKSFDLTPRTANVLSGSPGSGAAPGANGPPTTGAGFGFAGAPGSY